MKTLIKLFQNLAGKDENIRVFSGVVDRDSDLFLIHPNLDPTLITDF